MRIILILTVIFSVLSASSPARSSDDNPNPTLVYPPWKHTLGLRRVGQRHLDFYSGYRKTFKNPQGLAAVKLDFNDAEGPGDDEELTIYGVNSGSGEIFYNKSMVSAGFFGAIGSGDAQFKDAVGIGADRSGNVVVADSGNRRVVVLRNVDNQLEWVRSFELLGRGIPVGIALEDSLVYIADAESNRVFVADLFGRHIGDLGKGMLVRPFGVAVISRTDWNYYGANFIVVTDSVKQRLVQMGPRGEIVEIRRYKDVSDGKGGFNFAAIDYYGNVYVTDTGAGCIYKFDRHLNYVTRVGCATGTKDDLVEPRGITIHRRFGQLFVAEKEGASYFWIGTDVKRLRCTASVRAGTVALDIEFHLTENSEVTLTLSNADGETVRTLLNEYTMRVGKHRDALSIPEGDLPCPIANCVYFLEIEARATYSSRKYHSVKKSIQIRVE